MPIPPFDSTIWDNTSVGTNFNGLVASLGIDTSGGGGSYGHGTYTSASCGNVTVGYTYHLPPTWTSEPTRKFPVVYVPSFGGGTDENNWFVRNNVADPLADSPVYTSNQDGSPWFLNWGKNAKCVTIVLNGCLSGPTTHFDPISSAPMFGVMMMESQQAEAINFMESLSHPVFGGRLIPQGTSDPNGGKYRGIMGHSGGTIHSTYHITQHPERYASCFLLAIPGGTGTPEPWFLQTCNDNATFNDSIRPINGGTGAFGTPFSSNSTNIFNAGIWWHIQVSTPEGINETVSDGFSAALVANGYNVQPEIKIPFNWHTSWCYTGSGGPQPLPWHVSKFKLNPTCNGPSGLSTPINTALHASSATVVANDTDPQLLALSVASVSSPTHGTVSLSSGTVTFTPTAGFTGTASFNYTAQNTDGQVGSGTASVNVTPAIATITFPLVAFPATGASTSRKMPDRQNDVINVKDWGAVGDGVTNDATAIQAAIDYCFSVSGNLGGRVFLPPGTYNVGTTGIRMASPSFAGGQALQLVGAGKRASIIKGTNTTAILSDFSPDAKVELIKNLTVWNQSTAANSVAILFDGGGIDNRCRFDNLRLIGMLGVECQQNAFNVAWMNCDAICSASIGANPDILTIPAANSGAPGPAAGTFGFYIGQWSVYNCSAIGFDIGFLMTNAGGPMACGLRAYRCNTGFGLGVVHPTDGAMGGDGNMYGCLAERCKVGINAFNTSGCIVAGNVVSGEIGSDINTAVSPSSGPAEPAAIQSMNWNAGTHVVTVTTLANHNLAAGTQTLSLALAPSAWLPSGNTDGLVSCTTGAANTFTYAGPSSSPGAFSAGTWNYPMLRGLQAQTTLGSLFAANFVDAPAAIRSVDFNPTGSFQYQSCGVMAMNGKYGWNFPSGGSISSVGNIYLLQVGTDFPMITSSGTGSVEEVIFSDGQAGLGFNAVYVGGGSTQYKARRIGANFAVIG